MRENGEDRESKSIREGLGTPKSLQNITKRETRLRSNLRDQTARDERRGVKSSPEEESRDEKGGFH